MILKNAQGINSAKSTYAYDGFSRLRVITKYAWDVGTSAWVQHSQKKFVYDGMQAIQERDGSDNVTATNIWDGNIGGLEARVVYDVVTPTNPPQKYFYHYDGSGNVTAVTDASQQTVAQYEYDAYGNIINSSGAYASQNPWRFSTKYYDSGSGLYYYGYRFYSPGLGKWINRDPIAESGGLNLYVIVENAPTNFTDEYGEQKKGGYTTGPNNTKYRIDLREQPKPDMHIQHKGGETNITHKGGWRRGIHRGNKLVPLSKSLRKAYKPIIKKFVKQCARISSRANMWFFLSDHIYLPDTLVLMGAPDRNKNGIDDSRER